MCHPVNHRITHVNIGRSHIDSGSKNHGAILVFSLFHLLKQAEILLYASVAIRTVLARLRQRTAVFSDFLGRQLAYESLAFFNQFHRRLVHLREIIGCKIEPISPVRSQPGHIFLNGIHKLFLLLGGVGIVKAQIKFPMVLLCQAIVQQDSFGMADMKIVIWLRRKPGTDRIVFSLRQILVDYLFNKISGNCFLFHLYSSSGTN